LRAQDRVRAGCRRRAPAEWQRGGLPLDRGFYPLEISSFLLRDVRLHGGHLCQRVNVLAIPEEREVEVWTGGEPARPDVADHLALGDRRPRLDHGCDARQVAVGRGKGPLVVDAHAATELLRPARDRDHALGPRAHEGYERSGEIDAEVWAKQMEEGVPSAGRELRGDLGEFDRIAEEVTAKGLPPGLVVSAPPVGILEEDASHRTVRSD